MTVEIMSKKQEGELVDSVMDAINLANDGMHPNDAIVKIATDKGFNSNYVCRMVEAFNVSKTLKHQKSASGEAKAASFDIADPTAILARMYPDEVTTPGEAKSAEWEPTGTNMEETRFFDLENAPERTAPAKEVYSHGGPSIDILLKRACNELYRKERVLEDLRHTMASDRMALLDSIDKFASYFRSLDHEPFERVEKAAMQHFGNDVKPLMDNVFALCKGANFGEKRAECGAKITAIRDRTPYALLSNVMDNRTSYALSAVKCAAALKDIKSYKDRLHTRMHIFSKLSSASGPAAVGGAVYAAVSKLMSDLPQLSTANAELPGLSESVLPSEYEAESQGIKTQLMLDDFMRNDPVLSKADPRNVIRAYNDIAAVAPRAAVTPMAMRGMLRRAIEMESLDPHEVTNIAKLEESLGKQDRVLNASDTDIKSAD